MLCEFSKNLIWDVEEVKENVECCKIFDKAALCAFPMTLYQDDWVHQSIIALYFWRISRMWQNPLGPSLRIPFKWSQCWQHLFTVKTTTEVLVRKRTWSIGLSLLLSQSQCREHKLLLTVDPAIWNQIWYQIFRHARVSSTYPCMSVRR